MCGIVGYAGVPGALAPELLERMRDSMIHRGPDASGIWSSPDRSVVLGHRRLAIIDLSATGAQPMVDSGHGNVVVFNGEIYNHGELRQQLVGEGRRFIGHSDTEVLLAAYAAWGERCVEKLRGMFAFAIFDRARHHLFMARDRAGEKPLYWALHRGGLIFASELKGLMADPVFARRLSPDALNYYLTFGYVPGDRCILQGVHKLMPAHCLSWHIGDGTPTVQRYWEVPPPQLEATPDIAQLTDELQELLTRAVREELIADVPLAILLSGGVDSSIITALAARNSDRRVRTFTVTFPDAPQHDESAFARRIADHFRTDHLELPLDGSSVDLIEKLAIQYDEPVADSSMIPTYLLASTVSRHCKVVLGGDGGDELFGGYLSYQALLRRERLLNVIPRSLRQVAATAARRMMPAGTRGRNALLSLAGDFPDLIAQMAVWTDASDLPRLSPWAGASAAAQAPKRWRSQLVDVQRGSPGAAMVADFRSYLPEDILVKVDRASMLCSLEVRAPFLDRHVIEFAYTRVPNVLRATPVERKILLKALARRLLPPDINLDRKQGFSIPISTWLTSAFLAKWQVECREQIAAVLSQSAIARLIARRENVAAEYNLFGIIMLTSWMRVYGVSP